MKGFITLATVILVGFMAIAVTFSFILLGTGATLNGLSVSQGTKSRALANACANSALETIRLNTSFTGVQNLSLGEGDCTYTVTDIGGGNKQIEVTATVAEATKKVRVITSQLNPMIVIDTWEEVADF